MLRQTFPPTDESTKVKNKIILELLTNICFSYVLLLLETVEKKNDSEAC